MKKRQLWSKNIITQILQRLYYFIYTLVTTEEFGDDLEHVEVLQRKFEEFQKDMVSQEYRISEVCESAEKLLG